MKIRKYREKSFITLATGDKVIKLFCVCLSLSLSLSLSLFVTEEAAGHEPTTLR
jgi:hypothetical protein